MVMRPLSRCRPLLFGAGLTIVAALAGPQRGLGEPLDEDGCRRLEIERQALTVLGIDKYFENGAEWAKANLTVADLNLVKRYLNVYEQLKFRCKEEIEIVDSDEDGDEEGEGDDTVSTGPVPPLPERKSKEPGKAAAVEAPRKSNPVSPVSAGAAGNITVTKIDPAHAVPRR